MIDEALVFARRQAATGYEGGILALRAHARLRSGDLVGAAEDARTAFDTYRAFGGGPVPLAYALAALVEAELALGNLDAAKQALGHAPSDAGAGTLGFAGIRLARVRVRAAAGAPATAMDDLLRIGAEYESLGGGSPALLPWRSEAALLAKQVGRGGEAFELAAQGVATAAEAGARARGRALAVQAAVGPVSDALGTATEAVQWLEDVDAPIELAAALIIQGQACAEAGSVEDARRTLGRALQLCDRTQARPLGDTARAALVRIGGRPRRRASVGIDGLTSAERAVAQAAARGLSNREIAESLYIAPGTVKNQLASVYRKLSLQSRSQLPRALAED